MQASVGSSKSHNKLIQEVKDTKDKLSAESKKRKSAENLAKEEGKRTKQLMEQLAAAGNHAAQIKDEADRREADAKRHANELKKELQELKQKLKNEKSAGRSSSSSGAKRKSSSSRSKSPSPPKRQAIISSSEDSIQKETQDQSVVLNRDVAAAVSGSSTNIKPVSELSTSAPRVQLAAPSTGAVPQSSKPEQSTATPQQSSSNQQPVPVDFVQAPACMHNWMRFVSDVVQQQMMRQYMPDRPSVQQPFRDQYQLEEPAYQTPPRQQSRPMQPNPSYAYPQYSPSSYEEAYNQHAATQSRRLNRVEDMIQSVIPVIHSIHSRPPYFPHFPSPY